MAFEFLEKPVGTLDLLLFLLRNGPTRVVETVERAGMYRDTYYRAVKRLTSMGLAFEAEESGFPVHVRVGLTREGEAIARALTPAADLLAGTGRALDEELLRLESGADSASLGRRIDLLVLLADRDLSHGAWEPAEMRAIRLTTLAREASRPCEEALGRLMTGELQQRRDRHDEAVRTLSEAGDLARTARAPEIVSDAEYLLGSDFERRGAWEDALRHYGIAGAEAGQAGDGVRGTRSRLAEARVLGRKGDLDASLRLHREVVAEFERLGAEDELPRAYASLGGTAYHMGRPDAIEWHEKSIAAARRAADPRMEAHGLTNAAASLADAREFRKAESYLWRARETFESLGERSGVAGADLNLANLFADEGRWSEAEAHFDQADAIARESHNPFLEASVKFNRGQMAKRRGSRAEAIALLQSAKRAFEAIGSRARAERCEQVLRELTG